MTLTSVQGSREGLLEALRPLLIRGTPTLWIGAGLPEYTIAMGNMREVQAAVQHTIYHPSIEL